MMLVVVAIAMASLDLTTELVGAEDLAAMAPSNATTTCPYHVASESARLQVNNNHHHTNPALQNCLLHVRLASHPAHRLDLRTTANRLAFLLTTDTRLIGSAPNG